MQIILSFIVAALLLAGQSLWKSGLNNVLHRDNHKLLDFVWNIPVLAGTLIYIIATVLYMYVITKYKYGTSYALIVAFSLIGATTISTLIFDEKISRLAIIGAGLIMIGVFLIAVKK